MQFDKTFGITVVSSLSFKNPILWTIENPHQYKLVTQVIQNNQIIDTQTTLFGVRTFNFDAKTGFSLNGKSLKIKGVCMHHDLGALGAAVNTRAMERQLEILKEMGCNAIINMRYDANEVMSGLTEVLAYGTAVVVENA